MNDSTHCISTLISDIRSCLRDRDLDAAGFLREGIYEAVKHGSGWITPEEEAFLGSW